jgi:hypothetical protein
MTSSMRSMVSRWPEGGKIEWQTAGLSLGFVRETHVTETGIAALKLALR